MSPHTIESAILNSTPDVGYPDVIPFDLRSWVKDTDSTVLTGASTPAAVLISTPDIEAIQWATSAAVTVQATLQFQMPDTYAYLCGNPGRAASTIDTTAVLDDQLVLQCSVRRQIAGADAAAWNARLMVSWFTPGVSTTVPTVLTTGATVAVPTVAADNTATVVGWTKANFDIGARLRAEGKRILPGDVVRLYLGPDSVNASSVLQICGTSLRFRRHASIRDLTSRGILN
jgi:hypothetical protein